FFAQFVIEVYRPLIAIDRSSRRAEKAWGTRRIDEVRSREQSDQIHDHRVRRGLALSLAQHHTVQIQALTLAQTLVREEEKSLLPDDRSTQAASKLMTLERRWVAGVELEKVA